MRKLEINYDMPVPSIDDLNHPLVNRVRELVEQWNENAQNHFDMASDISECQSINEELKSDLILRFVHGDIADAIECMEDFERENEIVSDNWSCGRSGSHVWLHRNQERVLMIRSQDTVYHVPCQAEDLDPAMEWKYAKWIVMIIIMILLAKLVDNFLI